MIYVQRDKSGTITGLYANPQPQPDGSCLTEVNPLPESDPEVIAFRKHVDSLLAQPSALDLQVQITQLRAALEAKNLLSSADLSAVAAVTA